MIRASTSAADAEGASIGIADRRLRNSAGRVNKLMVRTPQEKCRASEFSQVTSGHRRRMTRSAKLPGMR
jgi:hypothetical protein